jgi:DMSO/TMAO reductase YedYZ molybdopterin-dependent catalytic subunit
VAEAVASIGSTDASPVVTVGDRVVDRVPPWLREWAIDTFGTADKAVLLAGVVVVLGVLAVLAGTWAVRGRWTRTAVLVGAVVVAGAAAGVGRGGAGLLAVLSVVVGGAVAFGLLRWLGGMAVAAPPEPGRRDGDPPVTRLDGEVSVVSGASRRRFLGTAAGVGVGAVLLGGGMTWLRSRAATAAERLGITLPRPAAPLPEVSPEVEVGVNGVSSFFTPNDRFYRIDTALLVPRVSVEDWELRVHGRVGRELRLDYDALLERPMVELDATIACVSNEIGGDLVGTARWLGCRLDDLLAEAGIDPSADQIVGRSVDGFTAGFPVGVLDGRDAIVAVGMNGEVLPTDHGYPARLVVPGLYGYVSATKWVTEIELTRFDELEGYWIPRGWDREAPVVTSSRIDTPRDGAEVAVGRPVAVGGVAWAPVRGISAVEVQLDDGRWRPAELGAAHAATTWRQWRFVARLDPGEHRLRVRAVDAEGGVQPGEDAPPGPNAASGWHTVVVRAR